MVYNEEDDEGTARRPRVMNHVLEVRAQALITLLGVAEQKLAVLVSVVQGLYPQRAAALHDEHTRAVAYLRVLVRHAEAMATALEAPLEPRMLAAPLRKVPLQRVEPTLRRSVAPDTGLWPLSRPLALAKTRPSRDALSPKHQGHDHE